MVNKKYFITTAIDYVNAVPHLGHALEKVQADVLARYRRIMGADVFFLSGTDENSLKNVKTAEKEGVAVKEIVDRFAERFHRLQSSLNLSYDDFIRTTEDRHLHGAQKLWEACKKDIYKKSYRGLYCVGCEEFYKEEELEKGVCPEHKTEPELVEEENYFFRLSKYEERIKEAIEKDEVKIIPQTRKNEILSFLRGGLEDICVSRSVARAKGWGIPVPGDPAQIIWVWFDALANYISAIGYGTQTEEEFKKWWLGDDNKIHVIGKGISRFHAVYWIGMLLSAGLPLPGAIFVHGYITSDGEKMSKSRGNVIDPFSLVEKYGTDPVRYYLLREIPPTEDGDFTTEKFEERYTADLAKGLGNLASRITTVAKKIGLPNAGISNNSPELEKEIQAAWTSWLKGLDNYRFNEAIAAVWDLIGFCDRYIEKEQPWKTQDKSVAANLMHALLEIGRLVEPFLPETSKKVKEMARGEKTYMLFPRLEEKES